MLRSRIQNDPGPVPDAAEPLPGARGSDSSIEVNLFGDGELCDMMRRQGVTHGCDGPVAQLCKERRLRLLPGNSTGPSQVSSSEDVRKVDDQQ